MNLRLAIVDLALLAKDKVLHEIHIWQILDVPDCVGLHNVHLYQDRWWCHKDCVVFVNVCVEKTLVMSTLDHVVS